MNYKNILGTLLIGLLMMPTAHAQLLKKLQKSAERTVERKLERKTEKETGKMMDSILDPSQKTSKNISPTENQERTTKNSTSKQESNSETSPTATNKMKVSDDLQVYSKFDFVLGDKLLFYDDFSQDFIGDFPSKWNTNGSGEVMKINTLEGHWF